jgi:hypothetical protein
MWLWAAVRLSRLLPLTSLICTMMNGRYYRKCFASKLYRNRLDTKGNDGAPIAYFAGRQTLIERRQRFGDDFLTSFVALAASPAQSATVGPVPNCF